MVTAGLLGPKTQALRLLALDLKAGKQGKQGLPFVSLYDRGPKFTVKTELCGIQILHIIVTNT